MSDCERMLLGAGISALVALLVLPILTVRAFNRHPEWEAADRVGYVSWAVGLFAYAALPIVVIWSAASLTTAEAIALTAMEAFVVGVIWCTIHCGGPTADGR